MGNFYTNYTIRGASQSAVVSALSGRTAVVTPPDQDCVVVFDEESDEQDEEVLPALASRLSRECSAPVLVVLNHDDDILWFQLYRDGELADEYDSCPDYFEGEADSLPKPAGGNAEQLCNTFSSGTPAEVEKILRTSSFDKDGYVFAVQRHEALCAALGISHFGVGTSFESFEHSELPENLDASQIQRTG